MLKKKTDKTDKTEKNKVTKDMMIGDIVHKFPESAEVMYEEGLHCIGCHVSAWESLEEGASGHGIDPDKLVKKINERLEKKKK
ncbi:MAG: DUF1858 domain-containing protein [Nanoarchaeota archaeon]|nr:DUF1858 domain-containing protein [Nanoarchaeota archaeon]MBU1030151.1 DUF1858 domain-containing protein [Nanoarchaeota archaeon]MBU1850427.1 DUF1858 domain-containing protein [Nanoarchaeota archaeon]